MTEIPAGYIRNAQGHLVPEHLISERDKRADALVRQLVGEARALNEALADFRAKAMASIQDFRDWSIRKAGVKSRARKGCCTLYSIDGLLRVELQTSGVLAIDERIEAVRTLLQEALADMSEGARDAAALREVVAAAFAVDGDGGMNVGKVLSLRRYKVSHPKWRKAMQVLGEATQEVARASYVRFYVREGDEQTPRWVPIPLALSAV